MKKPKFINYTKPLFIRKKGKFISVSIVKYKGYFQFFKQHQYEILLENGKTEVVYESNILTHKK